MGLTSQDQRVGEMRRVFRYLKRGVFPPDWIDEFTFGRKATLDAIDSRLEEVKCGSSRHAFVEGSYGRGKSHVLKAVESIALRKGFAVSWVTLDGMNHACNHPTRYFHSFLENLRAPQSHARGLSSLVKRWIKEDRATAVVTWARQFAPWWLGYPILQFLKCPEAIEDDDHNLNSILESRDIMHRDGRLWFDRVAQRMDATADLSCVAGFSGVVYLFDELETVATLLSSVRQRLLSYEFLNLLIDGRKHPHCFFVFAATPDFDRRVRADKECQQWYTSDYPEGCRFIQKWCDSSIDLMQLRKLTRSDITDVCHRLRACHEEAFNWNVRESISDHVIDRFVHKAESLDMGIRETIKSFVHLLEVGEQHRNADTIIKI